MTVKKKIAKKRVNDSSLVELKIDANTKKRISRVCELSGQPMDVVVSVILAIEVLKRE